MDETIIEYYYWDENKRINKTGTSHSSNMDADISGWYEVPGENYDDFNGEYFKQSHGNIFKPLKLTYNILYDNSGNPYNNLNITNESGIGNERYIYIFKPKEFGDDDMSDNTIDKIIKDIDTTIEIGKNDVSANNFDTNFNVESKFKTLSFDISENKDYGRLENPRNFILRPGKWFFVLDGSGNSSDGIVINKEHKNRIFVSSIKIPHVDFLYDNKKINMELNNITFDKIFLTIGNSDLVNMRNYFSKYYTTLGKSNNESNKDYMRIFFEFLLWTPNNINNNDGLVNSSGWFLPDNYSGITDARIQETPTYYLDNDLNQTLYTGYSNNEPGLDQNYVSHRSRVFYANHIVGYQYNAANSRGIYTYPGKSFVGNANTEDLAPASVFTGLSKTKITAEQYIETPNSWNGDIEINTSIVKNANCNDHFFILTNQPNKPTWSWGSTPNQYKIVWDCNYLYIYYPGGPPFPYTTRAQSFKTYLLKIVKANNKILVYLDGENDPELQCECNDLNDDFTIWVGADADAQSEKAVFNYIYVTSGSTEIFTANTIKDISDNLFQITDLSKNFINADGERDISFVNLKYIFNNNGENPLDDGDIDNWEAVLMCPSGVKLQDGSRNILSSYADNSDNSGFSLGIVGNGVDNSTNPTVSYIFKDVYGNIFPNADNIIDLTLFGVQFDISNGDPVVKEPFNIRYKIRKNEKTVPPYHDVYIFINDNFVTKIADNGCKLNAIEYWGTPYDPTNPYKEYDICDNGFIIPQINGIPRGFTTILQSLKVNYIEDIYRPPDPPIVLPDSTFIDNILFNDENYIGISGEDESAPGRKDISNIVMSYNLHAHKQTTITSPFSDISDVSLNPINNYPCTIKYNMYDDLNITPRYDLSLNMVDWRSANASDDDSEVVVDPSGNNRILKDFSDNPTYTQIKPLNYTYVFDAGKDRELVLTIKDFHFRHTLTDVYDRLEIVAGNLSSNGQIEWEKLKNNDENIVWLHNLKNTDLWNDVTPMSDYDLSRNTEVNDIPAKVADSSNVKIKYEPARYNDDFKAYDTISNWWQPSSGYYSSYGWSGIIKPEYLKEGTVETKLAKLLEQYGPSSPYSSQYGRDINSIAVKPNETDGLYENQYAMYIYRGYFSDWWASPYIIYYQNYKATEAKRDLDITLATYGTNNYYMAQGELKKVSEGAIADDTAGQGNFYGKKISLTKRDYRNNTDTLMEFGRFSSPRINGDDGTDEYGQTSTQQITDPNRLLSQLDINGSILPKNKQRAIDLLNFYNKVNQTNINSKIRDDRIWKIYTKKRFVRINYFAIKSSTNCKFEIQVDRTLSDSEKILLRQKWVKRSKTSYTQKNRGIMPVKLKAAYYSDLLNNQIESISNEISPADLGLTAFPNSNNYVFNNNEVPYISLCNYYLGDISNDIILSSRIKKTSLDDTNSYKYDDNRNLRELSLNPDPKINPDNSNNKIKQKYIYNSKLFNKPRIQTLPYIPQKLDITFIRSSGELKLNVSNYEISILNRNLINYWLGDIHKTYIKVYLYIWEPYSKYLINGGKLDTNGDLNNANIDNDLLKKKLNIDISYLNPEPDLSNNGILYNNGGSPNDPSTDHKNQFDKLIEFTFDSNNFFYGLNSIGIPNMEFKYKLKKFKGQYIFYWTYNVFQPTGVYNNISPLNKLIINNNEESYTVDAQIFDTNKFTKDDFIYDPGYTNMVWDGENSITISLEEEEKTGFKEYLNLVQSDLQDSSAGGGISYVVITFFIWTPNNCKYDKILGEDLSSNNTNGWVLPDDYYGIQDPRIRQTPHKTETTSWNPSFQSTTYDISGTTHYGYNFDLSGVIKRTFTFEKKDIIDFNIENCEGDISFNDLSFNITSSDISFNSNDILYDICQNNLPNSLEYLKIDNTTGIDYGIPYLSRWSHTVYDTSNQKLESRVIKSSGAFGNDKSFKIEFKFDPNYYYELNRDGMEGATSFRSLLKQNKNIGLTFGYKQNTEYLLIKVDGITYQIYVQEPPKFYEFFQLDENGEDMVDNNGLPIKIVDNTIQNGVRFNTGLKIDTNPIYLNSSQFETNIYTLYIRPSTDKEKVFFNSLNSHKIVKMESEDIRNRFSNWEPMKHINTGTIDSDNYYSSDNQYNYGKLFSTSIDKEVIIETVKEELKIDPCGLCRPINHSSKNNISRKIRYSNREKLSGAQAVRYTPICENKAGRSEELALLRIRGGNSQ